MGPLSRAAIAAMTPTEFAAREAEVDRWVRAGAIDGQPAPDLKRPDGHRFTREEIAGMRLDEFEANEAEIIRQAPDMAGKGTR